MVRIVVVVVVIWMVNLSKW